VNLPEFDLTDGNAAAFCPACGAGYTAALERCADCAKDRRGNDRGSYLYPQAAVQ